MLISTSGSQESFIKCPSLPNFKIQEVSPGKVSYAKPMIDGRTLRLLNDCAGLAAHEVKIAGWHLNGLVSRETLGCALCMPYASNKEYVAAIQTNRWSCHRYQHRNVLLALVSKSRLWGDSVKLALRVDFSNSHALSLYMT